MPRACAAVAVARRIEDLGPGRCARRKAAPTLAAAPEEFRKLAASQKTLGSDSRWLQFGGSRPGTVPAGTEGSTKDLVVYGNAVAVAESGGKHVQLQLDTLVRVGDTWRLIAPPQIEGEGNADLVRDGGGLFQTPKPRDQIDETAQSGDGPPQKLLRELEEIDKLGDGAASPEEQARLATQKAVILQNIADVANTPEDRAQWLRQLADFISATVQSGVWPEGVERLKTLHAGLAKDPAGEELAAYVEFRYLTAQYGRDIGKAATNEFPTVQANWLANLEKYVKDHPKSGDTAEAMLQLAIAQEFAGQEDDAKKWYGEIRANFPETATAKKATGAITRLECVGKPIRLKGPSAIGGKPVDLAQFKDKAPVLIQYWATWCEPALVDIAQLKEVQAKYPKELAVVGVSLDNKADDLAGYLREHKLPWPQIFEPGGLDSRLANEMGILTLPTMILVGKDGKVVNRNVHITELEREVGNLLHPSTATRPK